MADQVLDQAAIDAMIAGGAADEADTEEVEASESAAADAAADAALDAAAGVDEEAPEPVESPMDGPAPAAEAEDPKARFKTFAVSASQETSENGKPSNAVAADAAPEADVLPAAEPAPVPPPEPAIPQAPEAPDQATQDRIQALEGELAEAKARAEQLGQSFAAMMQHVTAVTNAVNQMMGGLGATPGYNALESFVCPSCGDAGHVTIPLTCTSCGETTEAGSWPGEG